MTDAAIENILFGAPKPVAPTGLLQQLQAEIALSRASAAIEFRRARHNPLRRWFPALAFSLFLLSCAIMIAVQANWSANLKRQNVKLRAMTATLPELRKQHAALENAQAQQQELEQLRKDNEEVRQLQTEVARLQSVPEQIQRLRNENRHLSAAPATSNSASGAGFFDEAQQEADRIHCVNNLKQLGLAVRIWAGDNNDKYSTSLVSMSNECSTVKILICPSDKNRQAYGSLSWSEFKDDMASYEYLAQPDDETHPDCIIAKCPIHHNYLLADGSVQTINPAKIREVQKDGRWYLAPIDSGSNK
jgi:hypothetical protein